MRATRRTTVFGLALIAPVLALGPQLSGRGGQGSAPQQSAAGARPGTEAGARDEAPAVPQETGSGDKNGQGAAITITIDGTPYAARLNETAAARDLAARLPLTSTYRDYGGQEKITDLATGLDLGGEAYTNDPAIGDIAYWSPQPRLVLYHTDVGAYPGINVIGAFTGADKDRAVAALAASHQDPAITIALA